MALIPAYNEQECIGSVIDGVRSALPEAEVVVVDDGSADLTAEAAASCGAVVLSLPFNLGCGAALQTGYKYAVENGFTLLVQLDADGQHDPASAPALLEAVRSGNTNVALGSRFLEGGYNWSFSRLIGSRLFSIITSAFMGKKITDPTSGFRAMDAAAMELYANGTYPTDFADSDVLIMTARSGLEVSEVPVKMLHSSSGKTMFTGLRPLYYVFKMMLSIMVTVTRKVPKLYPPPYEGGD